MTEQTTREVPLRIINRIYPDFCLLEELQELTQVLTESYGSSWVDNDNDDDNMFSMDAFARYLVGNNVIGNIVKLTALGAASYYTTKWLMHAFDSTRNPEPEDEPQIEAKPTTSQIGGKTVSLTKYEMCIASQLVDPLSMEETWNDIAGLDNVIEALITRVILPMRKRHLFPKSRLMQPPKGVLLYGPPGCGKTLIAKATAKEAGCRFINLEPSTLTNMWYGESGKLAAAVFSLAVKLQPTIIFIDEIDSFLRSRSTSDHEATAMMKALFLSRWDGLKTGHNCQVIIMGATNRPQDIDPAILRRMPARFHIKKPSTAQRQSIIRLILENENVNEDVDLGEIADSTDGFSGSDLREICCDAAVLSLKEYADSHSDDDFCQDSVKIGRLHLRKAIEKFFAEPIRRIEKRGIIVSQGPDDGSSHFLERNIHGP
ncbi:outer mitochondrial transmembrane helix translocase-like [Spea bombifrons]|uniref:outer mitochondrial transmembrane helix translocase-like n=1 Tax=Spea bombifrons TaxID=233779 RepID=UPI00234BF1F7|nr:outer mitochondrial transmembrane helix translocase-like [Spea bombifrons]